jgi:uncharacterized protein (TIGR00725 family)
MLTINHLDPERMQPNHMDIRNLTQQMHAFVQAMGWYQPDTTRPQTLRNLAISLNLEASEVLEHFQWKEVLTNPAELSDELADVSLYLLQLASLSGIDLEQAILTKLQKNYHRSWDGKPTSQEPDVIYKTSPILSMKSDNEKKTLYIAVFGGSQPQPGDPAYQDAYHLGKLLGQAGYSVLNGGYIGTMEAVSRGAAEAGGRVIGVTCDEIESWRPIKPNTWINEEWRYSTLRQRIFALIDNCDAALGLPGGVGTLTEISTLWNHLVTDAITPRPLILIGAAWQSVFRTFFTTLDSYIPEAQRKKIIFVENVEQAVGQLQESLTSGKV